MALMRWLRKALLHSLVWLTAAATLLAGTPQLQCRCPSGGAKAACVVSPVAVDACCCCSKAPDDQDPPPSCCHAPQLPQNDGNGTAFRHDGCQKALVQPPDVTAQRTSIDGPTLGSGTVAALVHLSSAANPPAKSSIVDLPPLPPPIDWQLVLQHFVI